MPVRRERPRSDGVKRAPRPAPRRQPGPMPNRERRRVARYRQTRRYYNDYQAGFQANPRVKRARRQVERPATRRQGQRALERERRRGPDRLARGSYAAFTRRLWREVAPQIGRAGDNPPRIRVDNDTKHRAYVRTDDPNTVYVSPKVVRQFMGSTMVGGKRNPLRDGARATALHEFAHLGQRGRRRRSRSDIEGGAEAFTRRTAPRALGHSAPRASRQYERYARRIRRKGRRYILRDQFRD